MKLSRIMILASSLLATQLWAQGSIPRFDFSYAVSDPLVNVFDDGRNMRIQLPGGTPLPIVLSIQAGEQRLIQPELDGTFLVLPGLHDHVRLAWANQRRVEVQYTGEATAQRLGQGASHGSMQPLQTHAPVTPPKDGVRPLSSTEMQVLVAQAAQTVTPAPKQHVPENEQTQAVKPLTEPKQPPKTVVPETASPVPVPTPAAAAAAAAQEPI
ncbi:hypothetical protein RZS08_08425, partial [Arthrospira platensis SPKY1]|nr:hypothetical protein [Arthrospira platensis SPKY1]